jgi:hypothetical protein
MKTSKSIFEHIVYAFVALVCMAYLFYLDEGFFNWNWMKEPLHWFLLVVYAVPLFLLQEFSSSLLSKKLQGVSKIMVAVFFGGSLGLLMAVILFSK